MNKPIDIKVDIKLEYNKDTQYKLSVVATDAVTNASDQALTVPVGSRKEAMLELLDVIQSQTSTTASYKIVELNYTDTTFVKGGKDNE